MSLVISDETLQKAHISAGELQREIAILLFQQEKLTMSQASHLADMSQLHFNICWRAVEFPYTTISRILKRI